MGERENYNKFQTENKYNTERGNPIFQHGFHIRMSVFNFRGVNKARVYIGSLLECSIVQVKYQVGQGVKVLCNVPQLLSVTIMNDWSTHCKRSFGCHGVFLVPHNFFCLFTVIDKGKVVRF